MRNTSVVLASMLALTSVSRALPLSMDKSSSERHIDDAGLRDSTLHRRLVPWLYTSRFGRKQMGGTVGAGFTLTGASLAMGGWYLNEGTKDMNHKTSDIKSKVSEAKQKELDREVDELWKHRGPWDKSPSAKSLDSRDEKDSVLYKRWSWGSEKTLNILKGIEDYGKAGAGTLGLTAGMAVLINAAYDNQQARKKLHSTRLEYGGSGNSTVTATTKSKVILDFD